MLRVLLYSCAYKPLAMVALRDFVERRSNQTHEPQNECVSRILVNSDYDQMRWHVDFYIRYGHLHHIKFESDQNG